MDKRELEQRRRHVEVLTDLKDQHWSFHINGNDGHFHPKYFERVKALEYALGLAQMDVATAPVQPVELPKTA